MDAMLKKPGKIATRSMIISLLSRYLRRLPTTKDKTCSNKQWQGTVEKKWEENMVWKDLLCFQALSVPP